MVSAGLQIGAACTREVRAMAGIIVLCSLARDLKGLCHGFNRFLNSPNSYLCRRKPKNDGSFLLTTVNLGH